MEHGTVTAQTRLTCVVLTVAGSALLISGVVLALARAVLGGHDWPFSALAPWLLVAGGLLCGGIMIAASTPAAAPGLMAGSVPGRVRPGRVRPSRLGLSGRPGPPTRPDWCDLAEAATTPAIPPATGSRGTRRDEPRAPVVYPGPCVATGRSA